MLSLKRYGWLCVLGAEIVYVICLAGGYLPLRTSKAMELHRTLFETLPGFVWGSFGSALLGAAYVLVFSWIFAWYFVWMHNTSLVGEETWPLRPGEESAITPIARDSVCGVGVARRRT